MKKKAKNGYVESITVECKNMKEAQSVQKAIALLDRLGYRICKKSSLVLDNEINVDKE